MSPSISILLKLASFALKSPLIVTLFVLKSPNTLKLLTLISVVWSNVADAASAIPVSCFCSASGMSVPPAPFVLIN